MILGNRANHTTSMKNKTTKKATPISARETTWGFHGTLQKNLNLSDAEAAAAFDSAARFTAQRLRIGRDAARRFLDSRLGRHLADQCSSIETVEARLGALYTEWKTSVTECRYNVIRVTDAEFYAYKNQTN